MALGTLYLVARGWSVSDSARQQYYVVTIFGTATAAATYFSMATGFGLIEVPVQTVGTLDVYWARYVGWLVVTPLILTAMALLAGADRNALATLLGLDAFVFVAGLVGALAREGQVARLSWWAISTGALVALLYVLLGALSQRADEQSDARAELFGRLRTLVVAVWALYPVVWLLGTQSGYGIVPLSVETAAFAALDLAATVGFGVVLVRGVGRLDDSDLAPARTAE
ncbi:bacteriorhodopsin [Halobaculum marinum]